MKEKLINELKTFDEILYGLELSARECHEIAEYIETLEKALDIASRVLEEGYGEEYAYYQYITYMDKAVDIPHRMTINQWYEWLMETATDKEVKE